MRTSPVHYIAPSAISIVPNCNGTPSDLAVTISRNAKIKVYSPRAGIDKTTDGEYQEWTITGRNRRLADSTKPYTIYARLSALDNTAYLIFAPMTPQESGEYMSAWTQAYSWVTTDGLYVFGKGTDWEERRTKTNCIFVRLGDVSLPDANKQRTVTLDTGILGTDQFNDEWSLRPDELPLRIELGCTIGDEDAGPTPYVYWGQSLVLTAMLTEGWTGTDIQRFDRWEIIRNSGDAAADNTWNYQEVEGQDTLVPRQMPDGQITLQHIFGGTDDFNGAVSATFTILAVGHNADTLQREILKTATINIMAETVATYELEQSSAAVTYNPLDNTYSPTSGVSFRIRTKAQDGSVFFADDSHIALAQLRLYALPEGDAAESRTLLTFTGGTAMLPVTAFADGKSINLWLENGAQVVLARTTVAYIRYGEKGDTPISIYRWYKVGLTPLKPTSTSSEEPAPAAGDATGEANVYPTDKWSKAMPDRPDTGEWNLWQCNSIKHGNGTIDTWSTPVRISGDKGTAGEDASDREYIYIRKNAFPFSGTLPANISTGEISPQGIAAGSEIDKTQDDWVPNGWSDTALPADNDNRYVYMAVREKPAGEGQTWGPFGNPVLWSNWGVRGTDGDGTEYVFIRTQNNVAPVMDSAQTGYAADEFRPTITSASQTASLTEQAQTTDDPKGPDSTYPYEWVATRSKGAAASDGTRQWTKYTGKNNDYTMSLWSRWAEDGGTQDMRYQWNQSATTAPPFMTNEQNPGSGWQPTVPDRPGNGYYLWAISAVKKADGTYGTWGNAIRLTGDKGTAGEDGSDHEYIYIRQNTYPFSDTLPVNISTGEISPQGIADGSETDKTQDDWVPNGWSDTALPADNDNRYVYMSVREKPAGENQTWGPFGNPVLWSNWGVRGTDGDGTEYVFIRTQNNVAPVMDSAQTGYASDEFRPTITSASQTDSLTEQAQTTDDPKGPNSTYPYEWVATRSKGDAADDGTRQWTKYTGKNNDYTMSLWSRWAEDGVPPEQIYIHTSSYPYNGSTPASVDADGNVPSGWSATPVGVSQQYPYEYRSVRRKTGGAWGAWSTPQLDAKWSSDGTSISIKGGADMVIGWGETLPRTDTDGFRCLMNNSDGDDMEVYEIDDWQQLTGSWQGYGAEIGDIYLLDGNMWMKQNNVATASSPRWKNIGRIQGPAGNDGKSAVRIDLDNQADIIACREDGTVRFTRIITTHARIYDGASLATAGVSTPQTVADMAIAGVTPTTFSLVDGLLTVTWQFVAGTVLAPGSYAKEITLNYNGESYTAQFSLTSSNTSAVYQLHPNMSEVSFQVDANGSYTPPTQNIYCGYTKTDGGGTQTFPGNNIANLWREGGAPYNIFWRRQLSGGMFSYWNWAKDLTNGTLTIDSSTTDMGIEFAMSSAYSVSVIRDENIIDRELVAIVKGGKNGPKGDDAQEVNPNILLRTIFDRGMDFVLEAWTRNSELIAIDGATDTIVNGRKSLRMNASALSQDLDFQQNVFGKVRPSTWYTLSFNSFATQSFYTFLYDASNTTSWIDLSEGFYIDGSATPTAVTRIDGLHEWEAEWSGNRHSITFKTASTFSTTTLYVLFRCLQGGQVAICMPKLEEGRVATAYMAHESDLKGDNAPYNEHAYALSRSRTSHADGDLYQVNGVRWFPSAPDPRATHPYVWERIMHYTAAGLNDQTSYICLTGAVGAMGKLCYIAGEYREDVEYTSNDSQTVAVEVSGTNDTTDIYYLNAESNVVDGTHISPTDGVVIDGKPVWVQGMSQYNLVRARYLFADFAQFGAAVVSGDWLISAHGTINGTEYHGKYEDPDTYINSGDEKPTYFWFDPAYPNEDHAGKDKVPGSPSEGQWASDHHNFIPHYAVNLLTGKTYQNDAYVKGEVHATSGVFNGTVKANLFYSRTKWFDMPANDYQTYYIDPVSEPYSNFGVAPTQAFHGVVTIYLPIAADYDGIEFTFFSAPFGNYETGAMDVLPHTDDNIYVYDPSRRLFTRAIAIVPMTGIAKVKSYNGKWFMIEGNSDDAILTY